MDKLRDRRHDPAMPARPPWPPKSLPRLFVETRLSDGVSVPLHGAQANYLGNVMRLGVGDEVLLFDGVDGEWLARVDEAGKKRMTLVAERLSRDQEAVPDLLLAFAPVKRAQTDWLVEKATELGIAALQPVMTRRTIADRVKLDRLRSITIEAAEQCHRTVLPRIDEPVALNAWLRDRDPARTLYFADETGGTPLGSAVKAGPAAILIGPEGGFDPEERDAIRAAENSIAISLGPRILRAETAALAAVAGWMMQAGDWK